MGLHSILSAEDSSERRAGGDDRNGDPPPASLPERLFDVALGLSVWSWAALGFLHAAPSARLSPVRLTLTALNLCVGALFILRGPVIKRAPPAALLLCLPSIVMSGLAMKLAPPEPSWPLHASLLFAASGLFAITSLATLGRCFSLLPAVRGVVTRGPFGLIRHPAYAGELGMIAACALASQRPELAVPVTLITAGLVAARVAVEERLLREAPAYRDYTQKVRYRLVPGVW